MNANAKQAAVRDLDYCVDLAKNKFQVHAFGPHGERMLQKTLTRSAFEKFFGAASRARGRVVMEACASAHHWARYVEARGYQAKLVPAQFVAKHRIGNKTDGNDADAIYAAHRDQRVRPVPVKPVEQQDRCARHALRELLQNQRTACINHLRGLLAERGWVAAKGAGGAAAIRARVLAPADAEVSEALLELLASGIAHLDAIEARLTAIDRYLEAEANSCPIARRLDTTFGIGPITATAIAARIGGSVARYADSRQFAASIGLTAREHSSGQSRRLGAITKRGDPYLRRLLVQCAQSVVQNRERREDALCGVAQRLLEAGKRRNVVVVAIANRLARIIYAELKHGVDYQPNGRPASAHAT